jgi:voltage-gated potassium channel
VLNPLRERIHEILFEADTPAGKIFDIALLIAILLSVVVVMLETVHPVQAAYHELFLILEWILTFFFTVEYILRLYCVHKPIKYATSFYGIVDLLAILPTYLSIFFVGTQSLLVIRAIRLLRVFRVFKLANYMRQGKIIVIALRKSGPKIAIFMLFILLLVIIFGSVIYLVEGGSNSGFDSISRSVYWAIVTITTVGYGDISPATNLGQFLAAFVMLLGYSVIAVPTGIVSAELVTSMRDADDNTCRTCSREGHDVDAVYCKYCGEPLRA